jgi:anti-sigma factor ChrR (cupin superfamily)
MAYRQEYVMRELFICADDIDWRPAEGYPEGAMQKSLYDGSDLALRCMLLKVQPGWTMGEHSHIGTEMHYILEGEYSNRGKTFSAGSFAVIPAHTNHGPFNTAQGAVILVIRINETP